MQTVWRLWGGEQGWLCQGPTAPPGTGYLKMRTDRAASPTTAVEKWGARSGAGRFSVSSTHPGQSTSSVCSWTLSLISFAKVKVKLLRDVFCGEFWLNSNELLVTHRLEFSQSSINQLGCWLSLFFHSKWIFCPSFTLKRVQIGRWGQEMLEIMSSCLTRSRIVVLFFFMILEKNK